MEVYLDSNIAHRNMKEMEKRIQNPVKYLNGAFYEIKNGWNLLTIFEKSAILNVALGSKCASVTYFKINFMIKYISSTNKRRHFLLLSIRIKINFQSRSEYASPSQSYFCLVYCTVASCNIYKYFTRFSSVISLTWRVVK